MGLPPPDGSKKFSPITRSATLIVRATPTVCVAVNWMIEVATAAQTKMGMRNKVIPLARIVATVTSKLADPAIELKPTIQKPSRKSTMPTGARRLSVA